MIKRTCLLLVLILFSLTGCRFSAPPGSITYGDIPTGTKWISKNPDFFLQKMAGGIYGKMTIDGKSITIEAGILNTSIPNVYLTSIFVIKGFDSWDVNESSSYGYHDLIQDSPYGFYGDGTFFQDKFVLKIDESMVGKVFDKSVTEITLIKVDPGTSSK